MGFTWGCTSFLTLALKLSFYSLNFAQAFLSLSLPRMGQARVVSSELLLKRNNLGNTKVYLLGVQINYKWLAKVMVLMMITCLLSKISLTKINIVIEFILGW